MTLFNLDDVTASYQRCRASEGFFDTFYDKFLAKSPDIAGKFRGTDFGRLKLMLRQSLLAMLLLNLHSPGAREELEQLAERHSRRGVDIAPHLYELWLDALSEAVELHDPDFTVAIGTQWRAAMRPGIDLIVAKY